MSFLIPIFFFYSTDEAQYVQLLSSLVLVILLRYRIYAFTRYNDVFNIFYTIYKVIEN